MFSSRRLLAAALSFTLLAGTLPASAKPPERRKGGLGGERRLRRREQKNNPNLIWQADLTLKRLLAAVVLEDPDLSVAELDQARQLKDEFADWLAGQGPAWNTPKVKEGLDRLDEVLRFAQFRLEAEFGLTQDLQSGLDHFVNQDYPLEQKLALLLFAADTQMDRGQLQAARQTIDRAQTLAKTKDKPLSPVVEYSLASLNAKVHVLQDGPQSFQALQSALAQAISPLADYHAHQNPIVDSHWLLGRRATDFWARQLAAYPDQSEQLLGRLLHLQKRLQQEAEKPWDSKQLASLGLHPPYDGYFKLMADLTLLTSHVDQVLSLGEALPAGSATRALDSQEMAELQQHMQNIPTSDLLFQNDKLGPEYAEFKLEDTSLVHEFSARTRLLQARAETSPDTKLALLQAATHQLESCDNAARAVQYYLQIGDLLNQELHKPAEAAAVWEKAWKLSRDRGLPRGIIHSAERLAGYYSQQGQPEKVASYAQPALEEIESAIPMAGGDSSAAAELRQSSAKLSGLLASSALAQKNPEMALAALNQGRQYSTAATQMSAHKDDMPEMNEAQEKHEQMMAMSANVKQLQAMPPSETRDELLSAGEKLLADSKSEFLLASRGIRQANSSLYSSALRFDPLNLPDVQRELPGDTVVIQYFSTDQQLYIFLVSPDSLKLYSVAVSKSQLDEECSNFLKSIRTLETANRVMTRSQKLYGWLIAPLEKEIPAGKRLVLIPAEGLTYLPFAALCDSTKRPLLANHALLELAKPTDFAAISRSRPKPVDGVTAFGNATLDLPESGQEAEAIAQLFPSSELYLEKKASKANFLAHGADHEALHIATHGQWDTKNPLNSHLELANGEKVAQDEILSLPLDKTALVTLSACNTAVAPNPDSDYVASLAEAFWLAGCPTVVATLWSVEDNSTRQLMTSFYSALKKGEGKAEALREAQLTLQQSAEYSHPVYWSGFVLFGDWR